MRVIRAVGVLVVWCACLVGVSSASAAITFTPSTVTNTGTVNGAAVTGTAVMHKASSDACVTWQTDGLTTVAAEAWTSYSTSVTGTSGEYKIQPAECSSTNNTITIRNTPGTKPAGTYNTAVNFSKNGTPISNTLPVKFIIQSGAPDTTPPSTTTSYSTVAGGSTSGTFTLGWVAATDNVGVTAYEVHYGNTCCGGIGDTVAATVSGSTLQYQFTGLHCGAPDYYAYVQAKDAAGNKAAAPGGGQMWFWAMPACAGGDTTPPSVPTGLSQTANTATSVTMAWTGSTDNVGVSGYDTFRGGVAAGSNVAGTSYTYTGLTCGTTYTGTVRARDAAGNVSAQSAGQTLTTAACAGDTTPPSVPTNLHQVSSTATTITMSWNASTDNVGVSSYDVYRGANWDRLGVTGTTYTADFGMTCGTTVAFKVKANDAAGNTSAFSPDVSMSTSACAGDTTPPSVPTGLSQTASTTTSVTMGWTAATDNVGVTGYDTYRGGVLDGSNVSGTSYTYSGLTCGTTYTGTVRSRDAAGNVSAQSAGQSLTTAACPTQPVLTTSPASLSFSATAGGANPATQSISISNTGSGTLNWTVADDQPWLTESPASGTNAGTVTVTAATGALAAGSYSATVTVTATGATGSPKTIPVSFTVNAAGGLPSRWSPAKLTTWYWQISSVPTNLTRPVAAYDVDGAENSAGATSATVSTLHANGKKTICYFSAGTWENWREDQASFPAAVQGNTVGGFPDEKWLDVRAISTLKPLMVARMQICKNKGFDAVEPDNMDGYTNTPGFPMTAADQITYNQMIAAEAHKLGLAAFLKNDVGQLAALEPAYDGAVNEQCIEFAECAGYSAFLNSTSGFQGGGKPVLGAEYNAISAANCTEANTAGRMTAQFDLALNGATFVPCWPANQPIVLGGTTTAGP